MDRLESIIAARIPGPFRPDLYQGSALEKARHLVPHYRAARARGLGVADALAQTLKRAPRYAKGGRYYSHLKPEPNQGRPFQEGRDRLQWVADTSALGLRVLDWADKLPGGPNHFGWYTRADSDLSGETYRGRVWQLPGGRLVYGFCEMESRDSEMNPGSACLCVSDIPRADAQERRELENPRDWEATRDAAAWADGLAESRAEESRDYDSAYQAGRQAAESILEAQEARQEALELLAEMRQERQAQASERPAICRTLRAQVESILERIREAREARASAWSDCPTWQESAWRDGYADESGLDAWNAFARTLGLSRFNGEAGNGLLVPR